MVVIRVVMVIMRMVVLRVILMMPLIGQQPGAGEIDAKA